MVTISVNTQSSILLKGEKTVYIDPWKLAPDAPKADLILLTHDHFDHFSPEDVMRLCKEDTVITAPAMVRSLIMEKCPGKESSFLTVVPGKTYTANGITFETVGAYNVNGRRYHPRERSYCGYVVTLEDKRYFVMGDTDENDENRRVQCDVLLIPVGGTYTMNAEQAALCASHIHPQLAIPTHYGEVVGSPSDGDAFREALLAVAPDVRVETRLGTAE